MIFFTKEDLLKTEKEAQDKFPPLTLEQEAKLKADGEMLKKLSKEELIQLLLEEDDAYSE